MNNLEIIEKAKEFLLKKKIEEDSNKTKEDEDVIYTKSMKNFFIKNKEKDYSIKKIELINLVLDLKVKNLKDVKTLYEFCEIPFNYESEHGLMDLYDICLYTFIKHNLYEEEIEDVFHFEFKENSKDIILKDNKSKFEWLLENILFSNWMNKEHNDCFNDFIYNLYDRIDRIRDTNENIDDLVFPKYKDSKEIQKIREYISVYEKEEHTLPLDNRELIGVILILFFRNYYGKEKDTKKFRRIIPDISRDYYSLAFIGKLNLTNMFSYDRFEKLYYYIFIKGDKVEKDNVFYSLFTKIIKNIFNTELEIKFSIQNIDEKEIRNRLEKIKEGIDKDLIKKFD